MVNYVIYRRLSKEDKSRTQHGFESQTLDISYYLEDQTHSIVGDFSEFISGGADTKPELDKAISLCKELGAILIVSKLDRLSRRVSQIAAYMESKVEFKVATMPSANNFTLHIFASLAEEERRSIQVRVRRGLEAAKLKGVKLGASSPKHKDTYKKNKALGLHKRPDFIQASRDKALPIVAELKKLIEYSTDSFTLAQLASKLNAQGLTTSRGGTFTKVSVSRLVKTHGIDYQNKHKHL